jgi:nucleotide-binding universal stress UspA family protein
MAQLLHIVDKGMEGCVMLALSTFRKSEEAVETAIEKSRESKKLMIVYVVDINLSRYFVGAEHGLSPDLKDICETDLLRKHEKVGRELAAAIAKKARKEGIKVTVDVRVGRFAHVCLEVVSKEKPSLIVTTRSKRPQWIKKFFGAPVDDLVAKAGCPVTVI